MAVKTFNLSISRAMLAAACGLLLFSPLSSATPVNSGMTTVTVDPSTLSTLTSAGFSLAPVAPATVTSSSLLAVSFPITGGDTTSIINHSGGLSLTDKGTTVTLANFVINVPGNLLTGDVTAGGSTMGGVTLFTIGSGDSLMVSSALAGDLTKIYGLPDLTGATLGTASIMPGATTATPEPASLALVGFGISAALLLRKELVNQRA